MRLLDTTTLTLCEFIGSDIPPYAILSHCWESEEVSFHDLQAATALNKKGYSKITGCCRQASHDGFQYAWVDTCCIDKTSSAELSEAINSMFTWYRNSQACYVYLADVSSRDDARLHYKTGSEFRNSRWFKRGWTLQELLAPIRVIFYDLEWVEIGTKMSLRKLISSITGIEFLFTSDTASIAQKMSWASKRETTRIEDQAYCLMGLFGVNMPPLYGEGIKAFRRLQLELLKITDDESIFAWKYNRPGNTTCGWLNYAPGLLADSPAAFGMSGDIVRSAFDKGRPPFLMTNKGIRMEVLVDPRRLKRSFRVPLNCEYNGKTVCLTLGRSKWHDSFEPGFHREWDLWPVIDTVNYSERIVLFVKQNDSKESLEDTPRGHFVIRSDSLLRSGFTVFEELDTCSWRIGKLPHLHNGIRTWPLQDYRQCARFTIEELFNNEGVFLNFTNKDSDVFVIFLWWTDSVEGYNDQVTMSLFIPDQPKPLAELHSILGQELKRIVWADECEMQGFDRVSGCMKSGKSVSVSLGRGVDSGDLSYFLDIEIDLEGKLLWPDLSNYLVIEN